MLVQCIIKQKIQKCTDKTTFLGLNQILLAKAKIMSKSLHFFSLNQIWRQEITINQSFEQQLFLSIVKTQRNSTQLKTTLKQLALELDIVVTCSTTHPTPPHHHHKLFSHFQTSQRAEIWHRHSLDQSDQTNTILTLLITGGGSQTLPPGLTLTILLEQKFSFKTTNNNSTQF